MAPVVILTTPRSGSSLLTKIIAAHGLWVGAHKTDNGHGYCDYENIELQRFVKTHWPRNSQGGVYPSPHIKFRQFVEALPPKGRRAVFKGFIPIWRVWITEFWDADFVFCTRDRDEIIDSAYQKAIAPKTREDVGEFLGRWIDRVHEVAWLLGRPVVNMSEVVAGDYRVLRDALALCSIDLNEKTVESCIDAKLWTRESAVREESTISPNQWQG